jgi:phosphoglycolate phosphatase
MAAIIFDLDGTIADSFDYIVDFLVDEAELAPFEPEIKQQLRGRSMVAIARQLGYSWWRLPGLFINGRRKMHDAMKSVKPFDGMPEVIRKLHAEGHELFVVSSTR